MDIVQKPLLLSSGPFLNSMSFLDHDAIAHTLQYHCSKIIKSTNFEQQMVYKYERALKCIILQNFSITISKI